MGFTHDQQSRRERVGKSDEPVIDDDVRYWKRRAGELTQVIVGQAAEIKHLKKELASRSNSGLTSNTSNEGFDKKAYMRDYMRKRRANKE